MAPSIDFWGKWTGALLSTMNLFDWVSLVLVSWAGIKVALGRPKRLLQVGRSHYLAPLGVPRREISHRVRQLLQGAHPTPADELDWLSAALGLSDGRSLTFDGKDGLDGSAWARRIGKAYDGYAARLDRGSILGANQAPVVLSDAELARQVSNLVKRYCGLENVGNAVQVLEVPHRSLRTEVSAAAVGGRQVLRAQDLFVSYRAERLVVFEGESHERDVGVITRLNSDEWIASNLLDEMSTGFTFDGVLPRVVDWREVRDAGSGRVGLHLQVAETRFSTFIFDHYPEKFGGSPGVPRRVNGNRVRALTLSAVAVTSCGHMVLPRRSRLTGSYQGLLGPTASGNLEFLPRNGVDLDFDANGMPNPLRALAREAHEEMGLRLDPQGIIVTGLARFWVPSERGTFVLLGTSQIDQDRNDIVSGMRHADAIEGAWEVDPSPVTIRIPRDEGELDLVVEWLVGSPELTPHATLACLGSLAVTLRDDQILDRALRSPGRERETGRPRGLVEEFQTNGSWA